MKSITHKSMITLGILALSFHAIGAKIEWTGKSGDSDWFNAANWQGQTIPGAGDVVIIPRSSNVTIQLKGANVQIDEFELEREAQLVLSNSDQLTVKHKVVIGMNAGMTLDGGWLIADEVELSRNATLSISNCTLDVNSFKTDHEATLSSTNGIISVSKDMETDKNCQILLESTDLVVKEDFKSGDKTDIQVTGGNLKVNGQLDMGKNNSFFSESCNIDIQGDTKIGSKSNLDLNGGSFIVGRKFDLEQNSSIIGDEVAMEIRHDFEIDDKSSFQLEGGSLVVDDDLKIKNDANFEISQTSTVTVSKNVVIDTRNDQCKINGTMKVAGDFELKDQAGLSLSGDLHVVGDFDLDKGSKFQVDQGNLHLTGNKINTQQAEYLVNSGSLWLTPDKKNWSKFVESGVELAYDHVYFESTYNGNAPAFKLDENVVVTASIHLLNGLIDLNGHAFLFKGDPSQIEFTANPKLNLANCYFIDDRKEGYFGIELNASAFTAIYDTLHFPVGSEAGQKLMSLFLNGLKFSVDQPVFRVAYRDYSQSSLIPGHQDSELQCSEKGGPYNYLTKNGVWHIDPTVEPEPDAGSYDINLWFKGNASDQELSSYIKDNYFGIIKRPLGSTNGADWNIGGSGYLPDEQDEGRKCSDWFARRMNITNGFSELGIGNFDENVLPVLWGDWKINAEVNDGVELTWSSWSEQYCQGYFIERSQTGLDFREIGYVNCKGFENQEFQYRFIDTDQPDGVSYYRIRLENMGGSPIYSPVLQTDNLVGSTSVKLFPQPAGNTLSMSFDQSENLPTDGWQMVNMQGATHTVRMKQQANLFQFTLESIPSGTYVLFHPETDIREVFVKQ